MAGCRMGGGRQSGDEMRKLYEVGRATVPSGASAGRDSCVAGTRPAAQSATAADCGRNASGTDERRNCDERIDISMTCCAFRGATALRTLWTDCAGQALFDEDATPCAPRVLS